MASEETKKANNKKDKSERTKAENGDKLLKIAITHHAKGDLENAEKYYREAIKIGYSNEIIYSNLGVICKDSGRSDETLCLYKKSIEKNPKNPNAHLNLGNFYIELRSFDLALASTLKSIELKPDNPKALTNLGSIYKEIGNLDQALASTLHSIALKPDNPTAHMNLGSIYKELGNLDLALASTLKSIELKPDNPNTLMNLGSIYKELGNLDQALASTLHSIALKPDNPNAYMNLGNIYRDLGNLDQAVTSTLKSLEFQPDNLQALINLGSIYSEKSDEKNEQAALDKAKAIKPSSLNVLLMATQVFKKIHMDENEIDEERKKFIEATRYIKQHPKLKYQEDLPINLGIFWLAYHGRNDDCEIVRQFFNALANNSDIKKLTSKYKFSHKSIEDHSSTKIGILSSFWGERHPVNLHYSEIINHLISTDIEVELIVGKDVSQREQYAIEKRYGTTVTRLTKSFERNCKIITELNLDLLLYPDIGMSCDTYLLGLARLAPVQAVMAGHPCSTGLNEIDYFISSHLMETEDAQLNYSEQLIKFRKMPTSMKYIKPRETSECAIRPDKNKITIGMIHSIFKLTPEFDEALEQIFEIDDKIDIIMFDTHPSLLTKIKARWLKTSQKLLDRIKLIPKLDYHDFIEYIGQLDIVLDPYGFGAGTVFYQCMACGVPVVTKPSNLLKTRIATGGYNQMQLTDPPVAKSKDEYIEIVRNLVKSQPSREKLSCQIKERAVTHLFNHKETLMEYEAFVRDSIQFSKRNKKLPKDWKALAQHF